MADKHLIKASRGPAFARKTRKPSSNAPVPLATDLRLALSRLEQARALVMTAATALLHQNAEVDHDIAAVLQLSVANLLFNEIERLEALIECCPAKGIACSS